MPGPNEETSPKQEPTTHQDRSLDLGRIRDMIENQTDSYLKGVNNTDVDWFLRESSVTMPSSGSNQTLEEPVASESSRLPQVHSTSSPHLNTAISNSNDNITSKTRPSVAAVRSENVASPPFAPVEGQNSPMARRRKSSVSSIGSAGSTGSSGGFFSKLKGKLKSEPPQPKPVSLFKENYDISTKPQPEPTKTSNESAPIKSELNRSISIPASNNSSSSGENADPRLEEYIKFYRQPPSRRGSAVSRSNSTSTGSKEPLPSALLNGFDNINYNKPPPSVVQHASTEPSGRLSSFLRRRSTVTNHTPHHVSPSPAEISRTTSVNSSSPPPSNVHLHPSFKDLKPLKRVAFHSSTFLIDPPQQIPSRNPRKGNVEILPGGVIKINPLTDEEKAAVEKAQLGQGGGIVVGGTFSLGHTREEQIHATTTSAAPSVTENTGDDDPAVDKHAKSYNIDKPMVSHGPHNYDIPIKKMALDDMYTRCCHLREILPIPAVLKQIPKGSMAPLPVLQLRNPTPTLVEIQTFADFVRIAPIICISLDGVSLTLEQFKIILSSMSAKTQLEKLSLRNTPIDNDGWSLLCWFLSRNTVLDRLDITQCPSLSVNVLKKRKKKNTNEADEPRMTSNRENRSDMDWSLLVATLVARGGIEELILTGCCINDLDVFEKLMKLAVSMKTSRLGLAYNQLNPKHFKILVENWFFQDFATGLDLGYNDFSSNSANKILLEYSKTPGFKTKLERSSLGFLSLNSTNMLFTESFKEVIETILLKLPKLKYLDFSNNQRLFGTFNSNGEFNDSTTPSLGSFSSTMSPGGSANSDSSSLDGTIPEKNVKNSETPLPSKISEPSELSESSITTYFTSKFPLFPKLVRLHLENNNFSSESISAISRVLPFCKNLGYFSLAGNKLDYSALSSLIQAVKNSRSLITLDCELEGVPDFFREKIGLYSMRNMERMLYKGRSGSIDDTTTLEKFESESLTEQLNNILELKSKHKLDLKSEEVTNFVVRTRKIRLELKAAIDDLLKLQLKSELNLEGKETLIKFIFIDSSIEKGLQLIDSSLTETGDTFKFTLPFSSAEDEKSRLSQYRAERVNSASDDQNLVQPNHTDIPSSASPLNASRSSSRTNLQSLNRQEGSMLKLSRLHDYHTSENGKSSDFLVSLAGLSGEDIRQKLMSIDFGDLDKIIVYLDRLKQKGITLENVFNLKENDEHDPLKQEGLDLDEIKQKLQKLANAGTNNQEEKSPEEFVSSKEEQVEADATAEEVSDSKGAISDAYDQVLNSLASRK